jgi:hypothetical protein
MSLSTNLQGYWKCDESSGNLIDETANNNDLTNVNTATFATGKINNGTLLTRASSQYFKITDGAQTGLDITGDISFSFWVKLTSQPLNNDDTYYLINKSDEIGNQRSYMVYYWKDSGTMKLGFTFNDTGGAGGNTFTVVTTLTTGAWVHVAVTCDVSTHTTYFYQNGSHIGTSTGSTAETAIFNGTAPFVLGAYYDGTTSLHHTDGMLDEIGVWSRLLSVHEVYQLYNLNAGLAYPLTTTFQMPTGGTLTPNGAYAVHSFILADTGTNFTPFNSGNVKVLVVGAGGGGGSFAGGGAGGYRYNASLAITVQATDRTRFLAQ